MPVENCCSLLVIYVIFLTTLLQILTFLVSDLTFLILSVALSSFGVWSRTPAFMTCKHTAKRFTQSNGVPLDLEPTIPTLISCWQGTHTHTAIICHIALYPIYQLFLELLCPAARRLTQQWDCGTPNVAFAYTRWHGTRSPSTVLRSAPTDATSPVAPSTNVCTSGTHR